MEQSYSIRGALIRILTPLVKILLRNGVSYGTFSDIALEVYVHVAMREFGIPGRKQSISRASVITGLTRKAVKAVMDRSRDVDKKGEEAYNRAARVITGWLRDIEFQDSAGHPAELAFNDDKGDFSALVKKYSGDMPARAILDELARVRAIEITSDSRVRLLVRAYLPSNDTAMKLHILGTDVGRLIATIEHNLASDRDDAFFQRSVAYDNLPREALVPFHRLTGEQAQSLLEHLDRYLSAQDRDLHPEIDGTGRYAAGVGIFYFEETVDHEK